MTRQALRCKIPAPALLNPQSLTRQIQQRFPLVQILGVEVSPDQAATFVDKLKDLEASAAAAGAAAAAVAEAAAADLGGAAETC